MPISFDLENLRAENNCRHYIETGLYDPTSDISLKKALSCGFETVKSIEIRQDFVDVGKQILNEQIESGKLNIYCDDSINLGKYLSNNQDKTIFFLDAHVDNTNIKNFKYRCPLLSELDAIQALDRKDHVILVDDVRILNTDNGGNAWGETVFTENPLAQVIKKIRDINKNYNFCFLDGHIKGDVLCAVVKND